MLDHRIVECPEGVKIHLVDGKLMVEAVWRCSDGEYVGQTSVSFVPASGSRYKLRDDVVTACARILGENGYTVTPPQPKLIVCPTCGGTAKVACPECGGWGKPEGEVEGKP